MDISKVKIDLLDFVFHVDHLNSGHDRDCILFYLESYLKTKKIDVDLEDELRKYNECDED